METKITNKDLGFIDDIDLRALLLERLDEIDRIFSVNGTYSIIFLSISTIEGIFKHIAKIFKTEIINSAGYPKKNNGQPTDFDSLTIEDIYKLLTTQNILPDIKDFEIIYRIFRNYRNFIHPQFQRNKAWPTDLGHAQIALGLLNVTINNLSKYIFIEKNIFEKVAGMPDFDSNRVLNLNFVNNSRLRSFITLRRNIFSTLNLSFDLELHKGSVFNFVFNYKNNGDFKMIRLDNRNHYSNCTLECNQKFYWTEKYKIVPSRPSGERLLVKINIDFPNSTFSFVVGGIMYKFKRHGKTVDIFSEFEPHLQIGFFNEEGPVKLSNIHVA